MDALADRIFAMVVAHSRCHQPNPHFVEDDDVDSIDEKFQHEEKFEDPNFQCFMQLNSPPNYYTDVNDEDLVEVSFFFFFSCDQEVDKI